MKSSLWTRITIAAIATCTVGALAAPAWGQQDELTLRRDGSQAVPFVAHVGEASADSSSGPVIRRDGSKAEPFVAEVGTAADDTSNAAAADGFDWSDAAIGAGLGAAAALLGVAGSSAVRGRGPLRVPRPRSGAASG